MEEDLKEVRKRSLHSDVRTLPPMEKAVAIVADTKVSLRATAEVCGVHRSSLFRASKASKEGRPLGKKGRPGVLTPDEEIEVIEMIEEAYRKRLLIHSPDVCKMVSYRSFIKCTWFRLTQRASPGLQIAQNPIRHRRGSSRSPTIPRVGG